MTKMLMGAVIVFLDRHTADDSSGFEPLFDGCLR